MYVRPVRCLPFLIFCVVVSAGATGQDVLPFVESPDTHYYDFWVGSWEVVKDGQPDPGGTRFDVMRGVHPGMLEETWRPGAAGGLTARAFRAWDKTAGRWMHVWISDNGLFQVWEGRKVGGDWYMFKEFDVQGDRYLSRQAVIARGPGQAERISERSDDGGRTWSPRFREQLRRRTNVKAATWPPR